jgi:hypothetical protein
MKMIVILYTGDNPRFVPDFLSGRGCPWTEFVGGIGQGQHNRHEGTRTFPGETMMVVSILEDGKCQNLSTDLRAASAGLSSTDRLHVAVLPVEQFA